MRLWSLHPSYLDRAGLTACWREGLLARKVLEGNTVGYRNHPQLIRFRKSPDPLSVIDCYLYEICNEAARRGYNFDRTKLAMVRDMPKIEVTTGQIEYEWRHLMAKLALRDKGAHARCLGLHPGEIRLHPLFIAIDGDVEKWEIIR